MFMTTFKKVPFSPLFGQKIYKIHKTKNVPHEKLEKEKWGQIFVLVDFKQRNMTLKVEQNTQILNFKSIVLNQEGFSKPKFILPHHNLVCRTSYPKKREKKFLVYSLLRT